MLEKIPIVVITIGYIIGIIMGLYCKISIVFLYLCFFIIYLLFRKPNSKKFKLISFRRYFRYIKIFFTRKVFVILLISSIISNTITIYQNNKINVFLERYNGQEIQVKARVISNAKIKKYNKMFIIKSGKKNFYLNVKKNEKIEYGDLILIKGTFVKPNSKSNYRGFDYKEYVKTQGIIGTINLNNVKLISKDHSLFNIIFLKIKDLIQSNFDQNVSNVMLGILLGYTDEINEDIRERFSESNISHILAVSGMHVGYLILLSTFIFERIVGKRISNILCIIILIFYIKLVGYSPSVVRAVIMAIMLLFSKFIYRKNDVWSSLSLSLLCLVIYNPFSIKSISLIFSYVATVGIIIYLKVFSDKNKIVNMIGVSFGATLFILPITAIFFNRIPILSIIINLISGIIVGPIFILLLIFIIFGRLLGLTFIKYILRLLVQFLIDMSKVGSRVPFNMIYVKMPNIFDILVYYIILFSIIFLFYIYKSKRRHNKTFNKRIKNLINLLKFRYMQNKNRVISMILIIVFVFFIIHIFPQKLRIHFVDVGQGDSCLIITPNNKKILIDGGGSENYDVGKNILIPYLLARRIKKIDYIIVSHFDTDHIGGILSVMQELKVDTVLISKQGSNSDNYKKFVKIVKERNIKVVVVGKGDRIKIEKELYFDVLWPNNSDLVDENVLNNNSIVCKMNYKNFSILFTGDIEEIAEKQILNQYKNNLEVLNSTILKVAHHGSKTSSIQNFVDAVKPEIALVGVGKNNKFGHPNEDVIKRLEVCGCKIYRTDKMGEITVSVNHKGKIKVKEFIK